MRILVTGADGFIGHHFIEHVLVDKPAWHVEALCSFHHGGITERLSTVPKIIEAIESKRVNVLTADLTRPLSPQIIEHLRGVDFIVNFASRSHVDVSIEDPERFFRDNVNIILTMLELARRVNPRIFVQISTDEVYGPAEVGESFAEWSAIAPSNSYSASKAAQEAAAYAWWRSYNVPVIISNTMNNIGERQGGEKAVPLFIKKILSGDTVKIHQGTIGDKTIIGSRHYLHARNHADAVLYLIKAYEATGVPAYKYGKVQRLPRFNVVGDTEVDNLELAKRIAGFLGKPLYYELVEAQISRPGHDPRYALDGSKLAALGWRAPVPFWESLERAVIWTAENPKWLL